MTLCARSFLPKRRVAARGRHRGAPGSPRPVAVGVEDEHALEADVGHLGAGAGVRAPVDVDRDRRVEVGEALLELGDRGRRHAAWSRRWRACRTRCRCRPSCCVASRTAWPRARCRRARSPGCRPGRARRRAPPASGTASCGRVREPCSSAMSASRVSTAPSTRPTVGATPTKNLPSFCSCTPMWSPLPTGAPGRLAVDEGAARGTRSRARHGTSRCPSPATRNLMRARERSRR